MAEKQLFVRRSSGVGILPVHINNDSSFVEENSDNQPPVAANLANNTAHNIPEVYGPLDIPGDPTNDAAVQPKVPLREVRIQPLAIPKRSGPCTLCQMWGFDKCNCHPHIVDFSPPLMDSTYHDLRKGNVTPPPAALVTGKVTPPLSPASPTTSSMRYDYVLEPPKDSDWDYDLWRNHPEIFLGFDDTPSPDVSD